MSNVLWAVVVGALAGLLVILWKPVDGPQSLQFGYVLGGMLGGAGLGYLIAKVAKWA